MLDFQQKRKLRAFLYSKITLSVLSVVVLFIAFSTFGAWQKKVQSKELLASSEQKVSDLKDKQVELQNKIDRLSTPQGVEEEIRSKFSVVKEGEKSVIIINDLQDTSVESEEKTFFERFFDFFR